MKTFLAADITRTASCLTAVMAIAGSRYLSLHFDRSTILLQIMDAAKTLEWLRVKVAAHDLSNCSSFFVY